MDCFYRPGLLNNVQEEYKDGPCNHDGRDILERYWVREISPSVEYDNRSCIKPKSLLVLTTWISAQCLNVIGITRVVMEKSLPFLLITPKFSGTSSCNHFQLHFMIEHDQLKGIKKSGL